MTCYCYSAAGGSNDVLSTATSLWTRCVTLRPAMIPLWSPFTWSTTWSSAASFHPQPSLASRPTTVSFCGPRGMRNSRNEIHVYISLQKYCARIMLLPYSNVHDSELVLMWRYRCSSFCTLEGYVVVISMGSHIYSDINYCRHLLFAIRFGFVHVHLFKL